MENGVWILQILLNRIWPENSLSLPGPPSFALCGSPPLTLQPHGTIKSQKKCICFWYPSLKSNRAPWSLLESGSFPWLLPSCWKGSPWILWQVLQLCWWIYVLTLAFASGAAMMTNVRFKPNWACKGQALQSQLQKSNLIQSESIWFLQFRT